MNAAAAQQIPAVIAHVAEGDKEGIDRAVKAARTAFETGPWPALSPSERGKLIWRIGELITEHLDELAELDNGKPVTIARAADVPLAADIFQYMAGWCTKRHGTTIPLSVLYTPSVQYHSYTRLEPVDVVGQIIPWNFPLLTAAWKLAPALATGCTVVLKVAEETLLSALRLGELLGEASLPPGVVNIVTGFGEAAGAALAAHPGVDKVAFTGPTEGGRLIVRAAANDLKKVSLELGGKSPNIVLADADLETAIPGAASAILFNHGQCCCAGSQLYADKKIFDDVVNGVAEFAKGIKGGPGLDPGTQMGPMVPGRDLRTGRHGDAVQVARRRARRAGERHDLRTRRGHLDEGLVQGPQPRGTAQGWHGLDQLLQHLRRRDPKQVRVVFEIGSRRRGTTDGWAA
jgi:phenylacetaldehyde dehydrogenase